MSDALTRLLGFDPATLRSEPPAAAPAAASAPRPAATVLDVKRLMFLLPLLRCPETGQGLTVAPDGSLRTEDGSRTWPTLLGRPVLFPGMAAPEVKDPAQISNPLDGPALTLIRETEGLVLNLSAGGTRMMLPNVVEAEAAVFRHTDVVADAHHLPFADGVFAAVIAYNAFEHYADPARAAAEIRRVLRPGGRLLIRTAFLQPLHEAPYHFYNCTRPGLERWFADFETIAIDVPETAGPAAALAWLASECEAALRRDVSGVAAELFRGTTIGEFVAMWREEAPRAGRIWTNFDRLSRASREALAAGFDFHGRRPPE